MAVAVTVTVAAGNDISLEFFLCCEPARGPWLSYGDVDLNSARATQSVEHCVVQQIFFRLVGILARTSPAGNAYAPLFFAALIFFKNPRADFCHISSVNCRERGATFIFFFALASR